MYFNMIQKSILNLQELDINMLNNDKSALKSMTGKNTQST